MALWETDGIEVGTFRLILAVFVVLSHLHWGLFGHNQGPWAVVQFYILSGYVMTALVSKFYSELGDYTRFLKERSLRIIPQFWAYLALGLVLAIGFGLRDHYAQTTTASGIALNFALVPLAFYMFGVPLIVTPSWTLGVEAIFYLVFPFVRRSHMRDVACLLSMLVSALAVYGYINTDLFGYRLILGTLFIFLTGSYIYDRKYMHLGAIWLICLVELISALWLHDWRRVPYNDEVLFGVVSGIPLVMFLSRLKAHRLDNALGNISYGVYLNHASIILVLESTPFDLGTWPVRLAVISMSIALGYGTFLIFERPLIKARRALRERPSCVSESLLAEELIDRPA